MGLCNSATEFGTVTRVLHWVTAVLVLLALALGYWIASMDVTLSVLKYFGYHKTLGAVVLALVVFRIIWHRISAPPDPVSHGIGWQDTLARAVHRAFYVLLLAMPVSGWVASSATGIDTVIFSRWTLPAIAPVSETWEEAGFLIHRTIAKGLVAVIGLHVGGALFHALVWRDGTLRRMVRGCPTSAPSGRV